MEELLKKAVKDRFMAEFPESSEAEAQDMAGQFMAWFIEGLENGLIPILVDTDGAIYALRATRRERGNPRWN